MEPAEPTDVYDFLYRDPSRVASYYAQIFQGRLVSAEASSQSRTAIDKTVKAGVSVVSGERKQTKDDVVGRKETIDPHDTATVDLIARLLDRGKHGTAASSPNGEIVRATGKLLFADATVLKAFGGLDEDVLLQMHMKGKTGKVHDAKKDVKVMKGLIKMIEMPSIFILIDGATQYIGSVKEAGLDEPISSFYARHGNEGLPDSTVVGIRERSEPLTLPHDMPLMKASLDFAHVMRGMIFPPDAIRLTPIAIYRRV